MANTSSAKKAVRVSERRTEINKARKSRIRTFLRKVLDAIKSGDENEARKAFVEFESEIMSGVTKGVFTKNTAARKLRRLAGQIRTIKKA